jgi:uncharacterized protein
MTQEISFLGRGWSFPPKFGAYGGSVATVDGLDDIVQSVMIILETEPGERQMRPDFGCSLKRHVFEPFDGMLRAEIAATIRTALLRHEPRIIVDEIDIRESGELVGELKIEIQFSVPTTNSRYNFVMPFYIDEATLRLD